MIQYKKILMTLALLLTAVTGAWAEETPLVTIYASSDFTSGSKTFDNKVKATFSGEVYFMDTKGWCGLSKDDKTLTVEPVDGITITRVKFYTTLGNAEDIKAPFEASMNTSVVNISGDSKDRYHVSVNGSMIGAEDTNNYLQKIEVYGTNEPPIEVNPVAEPAANTKQWTFAQPGSDVVLTPIYAKAAAFATESTSSGEKTLLPAAAEGVIAGTDASLIAEGTGIVATTTIGETPTAQGTVMYYVGTSAPTIGSDDWTEDVPTAKGYDDAATVTVWYYIQGADAPATVAATLDNTFNDSEVSSLTVTVLSNKFDLTLKAANANTIDATDASKGSVSVKVGDAAAVDKTKDITDEGKLEAVKMGSEVKLNTKQGYKFRKVEVKKKGAPKYADVVTICEKNGDNKYLISSFFDGTNANITTITKEEAIALAESLGGGNIRVVYEEYEYSSSRYAMATNAAGNVIGLSLSTTNTSTVPLYYVPASN